MVNVAVLGLYAWFTHGILEATQKASARAEDMAREARETLKAQIVATLIHMEEAIKARAIMPHHSAENPWPSIKSRRAEFARTFPTIWQEISPLLGRLPNEEKT